MTVFTLTPTEFEIHDDTSTLVASVSMFDEGAANITINACVNRTYFDQMVPSIQAALSAMKLTGDV